LFLIPTKSWITVTRTCYGHGEKKKKKKEKEERGG